MFYYYLIFLVKMTRYKIIYDITDLTIDRTSVQPKNG